ncbi:MAG: sigma-70 family RNA polymerase sigma factor [Planctomycetota bacterium]|nr:sigma-70 family RNA polymerase sigma factor [Planctomycetota bacterium]
MTRRTPSTPPGDEHLRLIPAVIDREPEAVDAWFRAEHPEVFRLCVGFLADAEEAEDVAQDAMLHLIDNLTGWDPARSWRSWRSAVVLNLCRDRRRRTSARARAEEAAAAERLPAVLPDPIAEAAGAEAREALLACLASLSPREREVFVLRDLQGARTPEVAATLGIGDSSVRSLLTLARRRLRGLLAERLPQAGGASLG